MSQLPLPHHRTGTKKATTVLGSTPTKCEWLPNPCRANYWTRCSTECCLTPWHSPDRDRPPDQPPQITGRGHRMAISLDTGMASTPCQELNNQMAPLAFPMKPKPLKGSIVYHGRHPKSHLCPGKTGQGLFSPTTQQHIYHCSG